MNKIDNKADLNDRIVVKYTTTERHGVESTRLTRNAIGYLLKGEKYIHEDDRIQVVNQGEIFFLSQGTHYVENIPLNDESFEQILFYYTPLQMQQIIAKLDLESLNLDNKARNIEKLNSNSSTATPSRITRNFLLSANRHYDYGGYIHNPESERLHLLELTYSILCFEDNAIKERLLQSLDQDKAEFERVIYTNLLKDKSVEQLAAECSRSLTSFKKEFKRIFGTPPHQWYLRQRLNHARLLLSTTRESISQVGNECAFPNTSHFIKLFKRHFGTTPSVYRSKHCGELQELQQEHVAI